ncbi:hypothetical protein HY605_03195 [Candidatus Peregrinibacteria bacterium]|nr:hypothetical protein [Candidatus Peregrinibacteria bacterium]
MEGERSSEIGAGALGFTMVAELLANEYREIGLSVDACRWAGFAVISSVHQGREAEAKDLLRRFANGTQYDPDDVVLQISGRLKSVDGDTDSSSSMDIAMSFNHSYIGLDGEPFQDEHLLTETGRAIEAAFYANIEGLTPLEPTPEQRKWQKIVLEEVALCHRLLGQNGVVCPRPEDFVYVSNQDFEEYLRCNNMVGVKDGIYTHGKILIDRDQSMPDFVHTLAHESQHFSGVRESVLLSPEEGDSMTHLWFLRREGVKVKKVVDRRAGEIDTKFALLEETMAEYFGYIVRLKLLGKYFTEICDEFGEQGRDRLLTEFSCGSFSIKALSSIIQAVARKRGLSFLESLKLFARGHFSNDQDLFVALKESLSARAYEILENCNTDRVGCQRFFDFFVMNPKVARGFESGNPLDDEHVTQILRMLSCREVEETLYLT